MYSIFSITEGNTVTRLCFKMALHAWKIHTAVPLNEEAHRNYDIFYILINYNLSHKHPGKDNIIFLLYHLLPTNAVNYNHF